METTLKRQLHTKMYIDRFWENLIKIGRDKLTATYLNARLELIESYWKRFLDTHDALLAYDGIDESDYMKLDIYGSTESNFVSAKSKLRDHLNMAKASEPPRDTPASTSFSSQIRWPRLILPTFSGELLLWEGFRDLFKSLVHDVEGLAPVQKLQYLKASTTDEAAAAIANIEMSSAGYALAWEELTSRYDNKRVLLAAHMRALLTSQPANKASASEIKRLITVVNQASRKFKSLGRPVDQWDDWFVHLLVEKLDASIRLLWESSLNSTQDFPCFGDLMEFLQNRVCALEAAGTKQTLSAIGSSHPTKKYNQKSDVSSHATAASSDSLDSRKTCPLCREPHAIRACSKFKTFSSEQRRDYVRKRRACFNCLGSDHVASSCPSANRCRQCQSKHHTLLHFKDDSITQAPTKTDEASDNKDGSPIPGSSTTTALNSRIAVMSSSTGGCVLLATARVVLIGDSGQSISVRALLDSGSEATFISERAVQLLRLPRKRVRVAVSDLQGVATGTASHTVSFMIGTHRSPTLRIALSRALVLPKLTSVTPGRQFTLRKWPHLDGLEMADPGFAVPAAVDCVLGADVYGLLCEGGRRVGPPGSPSAHQTIFGWVLMGPAADEDRMSCASVSSLHTTTLPDLHQDLQHFWKLEEVPDGRLLTPEETACEELFVRTQSRDATGRYIVRLPRKGDPSVALGDSRASAFRLLQSTERRLSRDAQLRVKYHEFMSTYISLDHMKLTPRGEVPLGETFYMPHHAVVKPSDSLDKIRVVFNASHRSASGVSLNDLLFPGPKLQSELWLVLTRWRLFQFAFTTDIVKMFRQIRIHPDDADLQRVLWRADPAAEVQDFKLTTVTYGTAPAPYLAIRTLMQLAQDEGNRFPLGATALRSHTNVDDVLAGADTLPRALELKNQLINLLAAGGFQLSKWAGSHNDLAPAGNPENRLVSDATAVSMLGVLWSTQADTLSLRAIPRLASLVSCTKRTILSDVAKFFDPLGWAAPSIIVAKVFIQDLWTVGLDWDQPLPDELNHRWRRYAVELSALETLRIPRWTGLCEGDYLELHGFSDASSRAYAACVYLRSTRPQGDIVARCTNQSGSDQTHHNPET